MKLITQSKYKFLDEKIAKALRVDKMVYGRFKNKCSKNWQFIGWLTDYLPQHTNRFKCGSRSFYYFEPLDKIVGDKY